jgi:hypothetical protein
MANLVGLPTIQAANDAIVAVCGGGVVFPEPAWDPQNPVPDEQIIHQLPPAGTPLSAGDTCTAAEGEYAGLTITAFYANPTYCVGPQDIIGLGWCPRNANGNTTTTDLGQADRQPNPADYAMVMPNVVGLQSLEAAGATILAACGFSGYFAEPAWDPAQPAPNGQVIHQIPAPGTPLEYSADGLDICVASSGPQAGSKVTVFVAEPGYCVGPEDASAFGWCPRT